jgi:hypothetical protein
MNEQSEKDIFFKREQTNPDFLAKYYIANFPKSNLQETTLERIERKINELSNDVVSKTQTIRERFLSQFVANVNMRRILAM